MFGTLVLLKRKADEMMTTMPPPPPTGEPIAGAIPPPATTLPSPMTSCLQPHHPHAVLIWVEQMMGVMAMAMLCQQGAMWEAVSWQVKVEDAMREITKVLEENREG